MNLEPVTLNGNIVRLEPLAWHHLADLTLAGKDERIWTFMRYGIVDSEEKMLHMIEDLLAHQAEGTDLPFSVISQASGKAIGMTRYLNIEVHNRAVEVGGTWYVAEYQHTGVNTECKFLLFQYAFEQLDCIRVQIKTDLRNERSQRAIERIGAVREGVLRDHMILPDGVVRSSVYYSILAREWPAVKAHLVDLINRPEKK
ncbi:MAG: GNAT family N-acetyltransferase [Anaerolineaceae bacterium]|nr:GNAT family N-acetyltransferase [Anaerolineaceae bacterium]